MKVAVCFSGQPRFFREASPYWLEATKTMDVDFFIHAWYHPSMVSEENNPVSQDGKRKGWIVEPDTDQAMINIYNPKSYMFEKQKEFSSKYDSLAPNEKYWGTPLPLLSSMYSIQQVGRLLQEYKVENNVEYDRVIFSRPDFVLISYLEPELDPKCDKFSTAYIEGDYWNVSAINDVFLASNYDNMIYWSNHWDRWEKDLNNGTIFCPHRLRYKHIENSGKALQHILIPAEGLGRKWFLYRKEGIVDY